MARKVDKTLSLPLPLAEQLEEEDNQSRTVAELLADHYGLDRDPDYIRRADE